MRTAPGPGQLRPDAPRRSTQSVGNAAAERMYGYTAEEAEGEPTSLLVPDDRPHEEAQILALLALHTAVLVAIERDERFGESVRRLDGRVVPDAVQRHGRHVGRDLPHRGGREIP